VPQILAEKRSNITGIRQHVPALSVFVPTLLNTRRDERRVMAAAKSTGEFKQKRTAAVVPAAKQNCLILDGKRWAGGGGGGGGAPPGGARGPHRVRRCPQNFSARDHFFAVSTLERPAICRQADRSATAVEPEKSTPARRINSKHDGRIFLAHTYLKHKTRKAGIHT